MSIMKSVTVLALSLFFSCAGNAEKSGRNLDANPEGAEITQQSSIARDINADTFQKGLQEEGIQLVDVRTSSEYKDGHISGSRLLDIYQENFAQEIGKLDKAKPVYVYCRSGGRSGQAMAMMKKMGFNEVYNLAGGMNAWQAAGKPVEK